MRTHFLEAQSKFSLTELFISFTCIGASKYIFPVTTEFGGTVELKHVQRLYCSNLENYVWQITHSIVIVDETLTFSTHILQTFS